MDIPPDLIQAVKNEMPEASSNEKLCEIWKRMRWLGGQDKLDCFEMIVKDFARERRMDYN